MTFAEKVKKNAVPGDLFPELTSAEKKYNYVIADIAVKIHNKRKELKLTQKEFAGLVGVSQGMVSKWESGEYNFSLESIIGLFDKLEIPFMLKENSPKPDIACYKRNYGNWKMPSTAKTSIEIKELEKSA